MPCAEALSTQAFIDGELTGDAAAAAERHIEGCTDCQAFCASAAALSDGLRRVAPRHSAPAYLRTRIERMLDEEEARQLPSPKLGRMATRNGFWLGAFGGAGITGLAAALAVFAILPPSAATLADQVTDAHNRALTAGQAIQVVSSDHHTVKPWFAGRIALSPPVIDFAPQGFKLTGGRLDRIAGAPAAVVVYQHGLHEIDLFVWADRRSPLPASGLSHGDHSIFWKRNDLDFAAVSDTNPAELKAFVDLVRAEPE